MTTTQTTIILQLTADAGVCALWLCLWNVDMNLDMNLECVWCWTLPSLDAILIMLGAVSPSIADERIESSFGRVQSRIGKPPLNRYVLMIRACEPQINRSSQLLAHSKSLEVAAHRRLRLPKKTPITLTAASSFAIRTKWCRPFVVPTTHAKERTRSPDHLC